MEIVVTDERDERFIEFCASFGCEVGEPQVVLLLMNFGKTVGCTYKLIRQLEKIAMDYEFKSVVVSFESRDDILIEIFEKLDYHSVEGSDEILLKKEFRSLV